jgi:DNA invertase Pin-like site-specific DNA recombinase
MSKINSDHLDRAAYVYVRQSTPAQVQHNHESQRRQYGLRERARLLGWQDVKIVDDDLGRSGDGVARPGFDRLLTAVGRGEVGAVFAIEASRLARNGRDWHTLLEFCAIVGALIIDEDGIYDPRSSDDQLMLGLKGTFSVMESFAIRQRAFQAKLEKAARGELFGLIAVGYVLGLDGRLAKDPNQRTRDSVGLVFSKFRELGSVRQVTLWLRRENVCLPKLTTGARVDRSNGCCRLTAAFLICWPTRSMRVRMPTAATVGRQSWKTAGDVFAMAYVCLARNGVSCCMIVTKATSTGMNTSAISV